ncbi:MAG: hypothetical protein AAFP19_14165 [Bacteroidota bacterium]
MNILSMFRDFHRWLLKTHWAWFLIPFGLVGLLMQIFGGGLNNCISPGGIVSFELARSGACAQLIMEAWGTTGMEKATNNIRIDYFFIFTYGLLLTALVLQAPYCLKVDAQRIRPYYIKRSRWLVLFIVLAGIADFLENGRLLDLISLQANTSTSVADLDGPATWAFRFAAVKFLLLLVPIGFLLRILIANNFKTLTVLWYSRFSVVNILILYVLLWQVEQGQDLLISINENWSHVVFMMLGLVIIALVNWYLPRYYFPDEEKKGAAYSLLDALFRGDQWSEKLRDQAIEYRNIPRLLGLLTIVIMMGAVINVYDQFYKSQFLDAHMWVLIFMIPAIIILLRKPYDMIVEKMTTRRYRLSLVVMIVLLVSVVVLGYVNEVAVEEKPDGLVLLIASLACLAIAFFIFVCFRKAYTKNLGLMNQYGAYQQPFMYLIIGGYGVALALFLFSNFFDGLARSMGTIGVVLAGFTAYFGAVTIVSIRVREKPYYYITTVFLILGVIFMGTGNSDNDYHDVSLIELSADSLALKNRVGLSVYFDEWIRQNEALKQDSSERFPVFILATNGGGSIAGYWTGLVNGILDDSLDNRFSRDHLFAVSGASGGSVGNAMYLAVQQAQISQGGMDSSNVALISQIYSEDFLASSIAILLGKDIFQSFYPLRANWNNSAKQLEASWANAVDRVCKEDYFNQPFESFWYEKDGRLKTGLPLYFANSMRIEDGRRGICSPVKIDTTIFLDAVDILEFEGQALTLPLNAAALLTARFPYVNPAAKIDQADRNSGHYVDGGYYDNTGASTALDILQALKAHCKQVIARDSSRAALYSRIDFHVIKIDHDKTVYRNHLTRASGAISRCEQCGVGEISELSVPLLGGVNSLLLGRVSHVNSMLKNEVPTSHYHHFILPFTIREDDCLKIRGKDTIDFYKSEEETIIPLGRYLSKLSLSHIRNGLDEGQNKGTIKRIKAICRRQ